MPVGPSSGEPEWDGIDVSEFDVLDPSTFECPGAIGAIAGADGA